MEEIKNDEDLTVGTEKEILEDEKDPVVYSEEVLKETLPEFLSTEKDAFNYNGENEMDEEKEVVSYQFPWHNKSEKFGKYPCEECKSESIYTFPCYDDRYIVLTCDVCQSNGKTGLRLVYASNGEKVPPNEIFGYFGDNLGGKVPSKDVYNK